VTRRKLTKADIVRKMRIKARMVKGRGIHRKIASKVRQSKRRRSAKSR